MSALRLNRFACVALLLTNFDQGAANGFVTFVNRDLQNCKFPYAAAGLNRTSLTTCKVGNGLVGPEVTNREPNKFS